MKKIALAVLSLAITLPVSAGIIVGEVGGSFVGGGRANAPVPSPFLPHITQAFAQIGTERLFQVGAPVLSNLSALVLAGKAGDGAVFSRLAEQLASPGISGEEFMALSKERQAEVIAQAGSSRISPEEFAAMSAEDKTKALRRAAVLAQAKADAEAALALASVPQKLTMKDASEFEPRLAKLSADEAYLSSESKQRVGAAMEAIVGFKQARREAFDAWLKEMPRKIYEGVFDKGDIIAKTEDGWRIAEHAPTQDAYPTYEAAFAARKTEIEVLPAGPWKRQAADELVDDVASRIDEAPLDDSLKALRRQAVELRFDSDSPSAGDKQVDAALNAYLSYDKNSGRKPGRKEVVALLKHYDAAADDHISSQARWRVLSALLKGDPDSGYPAYDELRLQGDAAIKKASDNAFRGLFAYIASMLAFVGASSAHAPHLLTALLILSTFGALAFLFRNIWIRDDIGGIDGPGRSAGRVLEEFRAGLKP